MKSLKFPSRMMGTLANVCHCKSVWMLDIRQLALSASEKDAAGCSIGNDEVFHQARFWVDWLAKR